MVKTGSQWAKAAVQIDEYERRDNCGEWSKTFFDPSIFSFTTYRFYCNQYRECDRCLDRRSAKFISHFRDMQAAKYNLFYRVVTEDTATKLKKMITYTAFPHLNGSVLLVMAKKNNEVGEDWKVYTEEDIKELLDIYALTPEGRRVTGFASSEKEMHKELGIPEVALTDSIGLTISSIYTDAKANIIDIAGGRAISKYTSIYGYPDIQTIDQAETLCKTMADLYSAALNRVGAKVTVKLEDYIIARVGVLKNIPVE